MIDDSTHRKNSPKFSRREFLKLLGFGAIGLFFPPKIHRFLSRVDYANNGRWLLGRVTQSGHTLHRDPDDASAVLEEMEKDSLWQITGVKIDKDAPNPIWFELNDQGYAHSSLIQPVRQITNRVDAQIPEKGCLGEITVPFVDAYSSLDHKRRVVHRLYYESTFWILNREIDAGGEVWYQLLDDWTYRSFYIPAKMMRVVPAHELTPLSPGVATEDKQIIVDLSTQMLTAYEADDVVFQTKISSGARSIEGGFPTPKGYYRVVTKRPCRHMFYPTHPSGSGYDLPGVPWVCYFTADGIGIHGTYWHNDFGRPHSHGCINMTPQTAKWIYRWTTPPAPADGYFHSGFAGTRVIIQ
jgi:lipoprotein-anchoring transpeptidase ErfK/SrfK